MSLRDLFVQRKAEFDKYTQQILKELLPLQQVIDEYMNFKIIYDKGGIITWTEVLLIPEKQINDSILILIGNISYSVGTEVQLKNGDTVKVTEESKDYFTKLIRIGVPYSIAISTKDDMMEYFKKAQEFAEHQLQEQLNIFQMEDQQEQSSDFSVQPEFDLSKLTPEQAEQLKKYRIIGKA